MLHQVEKKKDEEKKSTSTNKFNLVFNTNMPISYNKIIQYLIKKEISIVKRVNRQSLDAVATTTLSWETKIIRDIGPNVEVLRNLGETDEQVYQRHRGIIQGLLQVSINNKNELAERMAAYPHYYLREIITDAHFTHVLGYVFDLENFKEKFPVHADRVAELVLTDPHYFTQVIKDAIDLKCFVYAFPIYTTRIIELALTDKYFSHVFKGPTHITFFSKNFSVYSDRIIELALTDKYFDSIFKSEYDLRIFREGFPFDAYRAEKLFYRNKNHYISSSSSASSTSSSSQSSSSSFTPKLHQPNPGTKIAEQLVNYSKNTSVNLEVYTALVKTAAEAKVINKKEAESQETVLYSVIKTGQFEKAKILLVEGHADATIPTADGDTALNLAKRLAVCKAFIPSDNLEEILDLLIQRRDLIAKIA